MNGQSSATHLCARMVILLIVCGGLQAQDQPTSPQIRAAVDRALPVLELASAGSAAQRTCFTCHSQAMPVLAFVEAQRRGVSVDRGNLNRQITHTHRHLQRGLRSYQDGKGQGGGVDTAGYALWTLEDGEHAADPVTDAVVEWLLGKQHSDGYWTRSSFRPPSEASNFTTTYVALRALNAFGTDAQSQRIAQANAAAESWLLHTEHTDTEDLVFRLLSLAMVSDDVSLQQTCVNTLTSQQRSDGGWAQLTTMDSDAYATGTALYALHEVGAVDPASSWWNQGIQYLLSSQLMDGSWHVRSRSKPFQPYYETGFPHRTDQFISTSATAWATIALLQALPELEVPSIESLPGTAPLDWTEADLSQRMMLSAHQFVEARIAQANARRTAVRGDAPSAEQQRETLRTLLGVVETRLPPRMEFFGDDSNPPIICETDTLQIQQVRWPVFADVQGEGLLVRPKKNSVGCVIVIPDADQTPEDLIFGSPVSDQNHSEQSDGDVPSFVRQLAEHGLTVIVPAIVSRHALPTDDRRLIQAGYTSREWIYRQAFHMGRHVIGYEIQRVLAAVDWLQSRQDESIPIGIAGYGEGGLIAMHAAALDTRISTALISGYFDSSDAVWNEPIYRNVWSRLKQFGNAEVAALIAPRTLIVEHSAFPEVSEHSVVDHKGELQTPEYKRVKAEFDKLPAGDWPHRLMATDADAPLEPYSDAVVQSFAAALGVNSWMPVAQPDLVDLRADAQQRIAERQLRTTSQLEAHVQFLVRQSEAVRDAAFLHQALPEATASRWSTQRQHTVVDAAPFIEAARKFRTEFHEQAMGRFDMEFLPLNARTRKLKTTDQWTAWDVVLDVHDGLFSWGVLVVPNGLQPGERRPVVVCQHGRNAVPRDTVDADSSAYNDFAARLAERGFITFAPHNLYRGEDQYRWLDRKANTIGCTLFSFLIAQHDATLRWLESLPYVDGQKIAFYGLSYGGESAVRIPAVLEKYCLSICSGDFNQWTRKVAATDQPFSFMNTIEWEMPYWNLGQTFDYAEMTSLIFPRPFMVERGHHDRVARDAWVAYEFAKVRWLYAQFGMSDRVDIEFFQGGHSINGEGTFEFLDQWLKDDAAAVSFK